MSIRQFVESIPKVDLNLQLTGAFLKDNLLMIARQNGVPEQLEDYPEWAALLDAPDPRRYDEIAQVAGSWVMYPEDIARMVYDIGVTLSKQNVVYAEVCVAPSHYMKVAGMNIEKFIGALNDGRDRALRGWGVDMSWILCIPSDNPRAGDDVARWATSVTGRTGHVVAVGMIGPEDAQPLGQFRRAYATARKKGVFTVSQAGSDLGAAAIAPAMEELDPHRLVNSWGIHEDGATRELLSQMEIPLILSLNRALKTGVVAEASALPLRQLLESDMHVALSAGAPSLYGSTLIDEYMLAHEACGLSLEEIIELARRAIRLSFLDEERKAALLTRYEQGVAVARGSVAVT